MKILRVHAALRKLPVSAISTLLGAQTAPGFRNRADEFIDSLTHHLPLIKRASSPTALQ